MSLSSREKRLGTQLKIAKLEYKIVTLKIRVADLLIEEEEAK